MEHKVLNTKRGDVHYFTRGTAKACIVFTHGATMDHGLFEHQTQFFRGKYRIISWDVPCHGASKPYDDFSLKQAAEDLIAILDSESIQKAHFVGQSMGGYIIQELNMAFEERVSSLTMIGSNPFGHEYLSFLDKFVLRHIGLLQKTLPYNVLVQATVKNVAFTAESMNYAKNVIKKLSRQEIIDITEIVYRDFLLHKNIIHINRPLLITYGDKDKTGKVQSYCQRWAKAENAILKVIPNAAHNANMDNPAEFNNYLKDFLLSVT